MVANEVWKITIFRNKRTCKKKCYKKYEDAYAMADNYNRRVLFADMRAYPCPRHDRWHIGHGSKYRRSTA